MIQNISYIAGLGSSDYTCIHFHLNCIATTSERHTTGYNYGKANFNQMRDMLHGVDWDKNLGVSETWEIITELTNKACVYLDSASHQKRNTDSYY